MDQLTAQPRQDPRAIEHAKQHIRDRIWALLEREGAAKPSGRVVGKIPNFLGAEAAAEQLAALPAWEAAHVLKANPDKAQRSVRAQALTEGKVLYMAVPRLADELPFYLLDPEHLSISSWEAAAKEGAAEVPCLHRADRASTGRLGRAVRELETTIARTQQLVGQARQRLAGQLPEGASRLVSLHDPDARPIRKGRIGHPVEFGYKAQVLDNPDGIVLDHQVEIGNPADAPQLVPAIKRVIQRTGRAPGAVAADRGYGEASVDDELAALGVGRVAIPRRGKTSGARRQVEHTRPFRRLVKWRTGCEGRISQLKRGYGWDRTLLDGIDGARIWCGYGVLAHNLDRVARLIQAKQARAA